MFLVLTGGFWTHLIVMYVVRIIIISLIGVNDEQKNLMIFEVSVIMKPGYCCKKNPGGTESGGDSIMVVSLNEMG